MNPYTIDQTLQKIIGDWPHVATIAENNFKYKSLSNWAFNPVVGCLHGCRFCYVPSTSVNKQVWKLAPFGVEDPDAQWGDYGLVREWDEGQFVASIRRAENTPLSRLKADGNRAVMFSSTTDAYQMLVGGESDVTKIANGRLHTMVRRALELIRDHTTLNVRILTRSPLVQKDFDVLQSLGRRCLLGMSIPTLRNDLAKIYEPGAPAPTMRLRTLRAAKAAGIPVFVAVAPTYPECDEADLRKTMSAVTELDPLTVFHEPINVRAENAERIKKEAAETDIGVTLDTSVFESRESWSRYALGQLKTAERVANEVGLSAQLHLWPDQTFGTKKFLDSLPASEQAAHAAWLKRWWTRISEWP